MPVESYTEFIRLDMPGSDEKIVIGNQYWINTETGEKLARGPYAVEFVELKESEDENLVNSDRIRIYLDFDLHERHGQSHEFALRGVRDSNTELEDGRYETKLSFSKYVTIVTNDDVVREFEMMYKRLKSASHPA